MCICLYGEMNARNIFCIWAVCINGWMDTVNSIFWASATLRASVLLVEWLFNLHCSTKQSLSFYPNHPAILGKTALFLCWVRCTGSVERRMARVYKMLIVHWPENWLQVHSACGWLLLAMLDVTHTHTHTHDWLHAGQVHQALTQHIASSVSIVLIEWNRIAWLGFDIY